jgi:succinate dehydrogenase hydrophobic anchor subunit
MVYFIPDSNMKLLSLYHKSNKLLLPLFGLTYLSKYNETNKYLTSILETLNVANIGYHSYFSMSTIITDYVKMKNITPFVRVINLKSHILATGGFIYYIYQNK